MEFAMHARVQFITEQGKKILFVDLSNCSAREVEEIARIAPDYITSQPPVPFCCWQISRVPLWTRKPYAQWRKVQSSTSRIKKSAWIGARDFPLAAFTTVSDTESRK